MNRRFYRLNGIGNAIAAMNDTIIYRDGTVEWPNGAIEDYSNAYNALRYVADVYRAQ